MTKETCWTCKFWSLTGRGDDLAKLRGDCRIRAPILVSGKGDATIFGLDKTLWPKTLGGDYCGDYKANPEVV